MNMIYLLVITVTMVFLSNLISYVIGLMYGMKIDGISLSDGLGSHSAHDHYINRVSSTRTDAYLTKTEAYLDRK